MTTLLYLTCPVFERKSSKFLAHPHVDCFQNSTVELVKAFDQHLYTGLAEVAVVQIFRFLSASLTIQITSNQ